MPETTPAGGGETPTGTSPQGETPTTQTDETSESATQELTQAEFDRLKASLKRANAEAKSHREKAAELDRLQAERQAAQDAQLPEIDRLKKQVSEADSVHTALVERIVQYEVERAAQKLGVIDPDAAARLLDWDALEFDENGMPTNADTLLKDLLKSKPYLAGRQSSMGSATNPARSQTGQYSQITIDNLQEAMANYDKLPPAQQRQVQSLLIGGR